MRWAAFLVMLGLTTALASPRATAAEPEVRPGVPATDPLDTLDEVQTAISACWKWPHGSEEHGGTMLTITLAFKRNGEILSGRLNYVNRSLSAEERGKYAAALADAIRQCSPLPITPRLGEGFAGQPIVFHSQRHAERLKGLELRQRGTAVQILSDKETRNWCQQHGVALDEFGRPDHSDCPAEFKIPEDAGKRVFLVSQSMRAFVGSSPFLVWFTDWGTWPSGQRMHIFDRFRLSYGEKRPLIDAPGHVFDRAEMEDAISFVTLAVLFLWDCHVVTPHRSKLVFFSHDEWGLAKGDRHGHPRHPGHDALVCHAHRPVRF